MKISVQDIYGPYQVVERIGLVAYKLWLPEHIHICPVFHVSLLKPAILPDTSSQLRLLCFLKIIFLK